MASLFGSSYIFNGSRASCDWNQNRSYKSLPPCLSVYTHYIIEMLPSWLALKTRYAKASVGRGITSTEEPGVLM
jgi:hypothetical protein